MPEQRFYCSRERDRLDVDIFLQPLERTMQEQISTMQPLENLTPQELSIS